MQENFPCSYEYTVVSGDSYYSIAQKLGVDLQELLNANPMVPPARLTVGNRLCVPAKELNMPAQDAPVQEMTEIAQVQEETVTPVQEEKAEIPAPAAVPQTAAVCPPDQGAGEIPPFCPPNRRTVVQIDQTAEELQLKYGLSYYTLQLANPSIDLDNLQGGDILCIPESNTACPVHPTYTLKNGEYLEKAAMNLRVPVSALLRANPCLSPADFEAGVTINIPRSR